MNPPGFDFGMRETLSQLFKTDLLTVFGFHMLVENCQVHNKR